MASEHNQKHRAGQLFVVATPIGNLDDITLRAIDTLKNADLIACEDTRHSRKLLSRLGIATPTVSYHEHNEAARARELLARLQDGADIALISDAGTPLIADPGYRIVALMHAQGIRVTPIPGPCSVIAALCASGLPTDRFMFMGFLPRSGKARREAFDHIATAGQTCILFESPRRLTATLQNLRELCPPPRRLCVCREVSKLHEDFVNGDIDAQIEHFDATPPRGEIILLIAPVEPAIVDDVAIITQLNAPELQHLSTSERVRRVAALLGAAKNRVYALAIRKTP
ncbi:MAG: 16S rRNA (cytidine(1402)-2'-O)-methyltransferase [Mariprofundaceae bacterium]